MKKKTIRDIKVGDSDSFTKTVTEADVYNFAGVSGDFNPVHINETYAKETMFKDRIAHGVLSVSFISTVVGTLLPGPGSIYLSQEVKFVKPVYFNDTITATCTVTEIIEEKNRVHLDTVCTNQRGEEVITGSVKVFLPD
ncbi:MAG: MaoC family dehydratase [Bacillota bacterium]|nr:MaoC family dehydratase [Bacillota bacterium]